MVAPMPTRIEMVGGVVAIVKAETITLRALETLFARKDRGISTYRDINQGNTRPKVRIRIDLIDKRVLTPVAHHEAYAQEHKREDECEESRARVHPLIERVDGAVIAQLPRPSLDSQQSLALADKVERELEPDKEEKAADVAQEIAEVVALVPHCGRQIAGPVALDMVVFDVVVEVRVPGMAHERVRDVGEERVEGPEGSGQNTAHVDVLVHHQRVAADIVGLHDPVQEAMEPGEVVVQVDGAGDDSGEV